MREKEKDLKSSPKQNCKKRHSNLRLPKLFSLFNCFLIIVKFFADFKYNTLSKMLPLSVCLCVSVCVCVRVCCTCACKRERGRRRKREITVQLLWNFLGKWEAINNLCGQSLWLKSCISSFSTRFLSFVVKGHAKHLFYWIY